MHVDDTELHYVDYDAEKTWDEMMRVYLKEGGDILYPGDEKEILLRSVLAIATAIILLFFMIILLPGPSCPACNRTVCGSGHSQPRQPRRVFRGGISFRRRLPQLSAPSSIISGGP